MKLKQERKSRAAEREPRTEHKKRHVTVHGERRDKLAPAAAPAPGRSQAWLASSKKGEITTCSVHSPFAAELSKHDNPGEGSKSRGDGGHDGGGQDHRHHNKTDGGPLVKLLFYFAKGKFNSLE